MSVVRAQNGVCSLHRQEAPSINVMLELFRDFHHCAVSDSFPSILFDPGRRFFQRSTGSVTVGGTGTSKRLQPDKGIAASKMITESARTRRFAALTLIDLTSPANSLSEFKTIPLQLAYEHRIRKRELGFIE